MVIVRCLISNRSKRVPRWRRASNSWRATHSLRWLTEARRAFDWFLGANDLGEPLYDPATGGCHDGLLCDRVNGNQGGELVLAFLLAAVEMSAALASAARTGIHDAVKTAR